MPTMLWSGRIWNIADETYPPAASPGFDWNPNIPIDANGWLHLNLEKVGGVWKAPMIYDTVRTGYGTYRTVLAGIHALDKNAVLGLFPYDWDHQHELDIEQAKWGAENNPSWQFTIQPSEETGQRAQTTFSPAMPNNNDILAQIVWTPTGESFLMQDLVTGTILKQWSSSIPVPATTPGIARMFINLYPFCDFGAGVSYPPASNQSYVLKSFAFVPPGDTIYDTFTDAALSSEVVNLGESVLITGNVSTTIGPVGGGVVTFTSSNGDVISSVITDSNGNFSKEYRPSRPGPTTIVAYYNGTA
jgi:hypothetical protein